MLSRIVHFALLLGVVACEDPTLYVGTRPADEPTVRVDGGHAPRDASEPSEPDQPFPEADPREDDRDGTTAEGATIEDALMDAGMAPSDDGGFMLPWPRFAFRCYSDFECARYRRGVCEQNWCVQCRTAAHCPWGMRCTPDHVCVRR